MEDISVEVTDRSKWVKSATGGTTSSQISYYRDQPSTWRRWADTQAMNAWYGYHVGDRVAYLWGAMQDFAVKPSLGMRLRNSMYKRCLMLPSSPLDESILDNYLEKLDRWRPSFIQAYASSLHEFCRHLKARNRCLPYLRGASVTAERLYSHQRKEIEEVLGFKVFDWYGSRELGRVASECENHEGLHINEPSVYVEVEQDPSLPDNCGHLIVTDLWNRATPMIRYRTGDIARLIVGECSCGKALKRIASLEGRLTDTFVLSDGKRVNGLIMAHSVMSNSTEIVERQIIQKTLTNFHVRFVRGPEFTASSLRTFGDSLKRVLNPEISITFEQVSEIPRERSGKIRFVKCEIEDPGGLTPISAGDQREEFHV
ncbi:MAG: phenylacetate--CoA ligase family protein [Deltaproteobacteria bacterium]|nr:phenylacetate--CoA ligase family protein [Deltaproteobacteria bacterium]TLN03587.1 MAG: phenylacetate--CoA ligase family protein [bacterium]